MIPRGSLFFGAAAFIVLWALTVAGAIAVVPSWAATDPEYEEGVITPGGNYFVWARALLTIGSIVVWACIGLGYALTATKDMPFGFWERHASLLNGSLLFSDVIFLLAVFFISRARGTGRWVLWLAVPAMAFASVVGSLVLLL